MRAGFPHSEICGSAPICRLPAAYRRLSRPSSPVIAKASTTCTYSLDPITLPPVARSGFAIRLLFSACAVLAPFSIRKHHDAIHNPGLCRRQPKQHGRLPQRHLLFPEFLKISRSLAGQQSKGTPLEPPSPTSEEARRERRRRLRSLLPSLVCPTALVEPTGIEPVTSCLQSRRSPS